ncbi:hypothetical protein RND81_14G189700 [Saponaria officinalis]|uniref:Uncharacterized protein n=1 Tax=Saponaria officinalis TaxID=3572 RepID=A0AAW1GRM0_SAPOF
MSLHRLRSSSSSSSAVPSRPQLAATKTLELIHSDICTFLPHHRELIREIYGFGENVEFYIPTDKERADFVSPGWACLYAYPFSLGLRFPFPKLIQDFFREYGIAMGQLVPGGLEDTSRGGGFTGGETIVAEGGRFGGMLYMSISWWWPWSNRLWIVVVLSAASGNLKRVAPSSLLGEMKRLMKASASASLVQSVEADPSRSYGAEMGKPSSRPPPASAKSSARSSARLAPLQMSRATSAPTASEDIVARFPPDFRASHTESLPLLKQLLFDRGAEAPDAKDAQANCAELAMLLFQGLQSSLFLCDAMRTAENEREAAALQARLAKEKELERELRVKQAEEQVLDLKGLLAKEMNELSKYRDENPALSEEDLVREISGYYTWLARIECMEECARGEHLSWDVNKERAEFAETFGTPLDFLSSGAERGESSGVATVDAVDPVVGGELSEGGSPTHTDALPVLGTPPSSAQPEFPEGAAPAQDEN